MSTVFGTRLILKKTMTMTKAGAFLLGLCSLLCACTETTGTLGIIETGENFITIGINEDKTFPKIKDYDDLGRIACQINCSQTIRDEIAEFLKGSEWSDIFCFPEFISKNGPGSDVWALKFICYKDND